MDDPLKLRHEVPENLNFYFCLCCFGDDELVSALFRGRGVERIFSTVGLQRSPTCPSLFVPSRPKVGMWISRAELESSWRVRVRVSGVAASHNVADDEVKYSVLRTIFVTACRSFSF